MGTRRASSKELRQWPQQPLDGCEGLIGSERSSAWPKVTQLACGKGKRELSSGCSFRVP